MTEATGTPAAYYYNLSTFSSADYNDYYSNYTYPIYASGNKTLAQWQAYGQDSNSVNIDPIFNSDSTLVPQVLSLDNLGAPISGITDDIYGSTRSTTTPDMGAVEFTVEGSALSGSYTIGSGGDYETFAAALNGIAILGIGGPGTFNILAGTYDEPLELGAILGVSATNTITFQSADANADSVIWENTANSSQSNYVLHLNGTDHITLKHITFKNQGSSYGRRIVFSGVEDIIFPTSIFVS